MKVTRLKLMIFLVPLILSGCKSDSPNTEQQAEPETERQAFVADYAPPVFLSDSRAEKIRSIAPKLQELIAAHAEEYHIPGVAYGIVVDNELVIADGTGLVSLEDNRKATPRSAFRIASMTKSFTAMAIIRLRDEGKLSLEDPVSKYVPEMADLEYLTSDAPVIDIENLLTMTAGFPEDNPWGDRQLDEPDQMLVDLIANGISFSNAPSFAYEYSNTGYAILGHIVSTVAGMPYQEYITEQILHPLGMTATYWEYDSVPSDALVHGYRWEDDEWKPEPMLHDGSFGAMGGLITTIEDFSRYVSFHLSAWPPRSEPDHGPVRRSSLREMQTPQFSRLYAQATDSDGNACPTMGGYGYGLGVSTYCDGLVRVGHGGALPGYGSDYRFFPEYGIGVMAFCNLTYTPAYPYREIARLLFDELELAPRSLPVSEILQVRKDQLVSLLSDWSPSLENEILAENFYLDISREHRIAEAKEIFGSAGEITGTSDLRPENQLRGSFVIHTEKQDVNVFFTLTPEKNPRVQMLELMAVDR